MGDAKPLVVAILGPTATGKSALALALAERYDGEIINCDSTAVYRGFDIGTDKVPLAERRGIPHHLIDIVDPDQSYSVGRFRADAIRAVADISRRGKIPLLVGGTMLYYRALASGLDTLPAAEPELRAEIEREAARNGWPALHAQLARFDPKTAQRIAPSDAQRIQRAIEVWRLTGMPLSALQAATRQLPPFELRAFALVPEDRDCLHRRIAARFDAMLRAGLVEEGRTLRQRYRLSPRMPSMRCVGYRQVWSYLEGDCGEAALREKAIAATRQLAKRQLTWLRSFREVQRLEEPSAEALAERITWAP